MNRIAIYVTSSLLAFTCGIITSALLAGRHVPAENASPRAEVVAIPTTPPTPEAEVTPTPELEVVFGSRGLKLVPEEVRLVSDRRHYEINVTYPQVDGSDGLHIRRLNQRIRELTTREYQWPLNLSEKDLRDSLRMHPEVTNTVDINYDVTSATDSMVSIYFGEYSYGIGAAHAVQRSLVVNYDFASGKELKLSDLFAPGSKYREFISQYCKDEIKLNDGLEPFADALEPGSGNFESWNATPTGIRFNFDACSIAGCSSGQFEVEVPYSDLKSMLSARGLSILPISSVVKVKANH